ncbi:hypothetical protein [Lacticaseibacillus yichunensis]|uniref:Uncharacterized protein n=1 Tax=Lacticaseibacillus yichunensis TaxID=2486015 RepID=A0ABW4CQF9_9LACO|nr:hypothetical protein [Lacticaseibacillus yichunensis]
MTKFQMTITINGEIYTTAQLKRFKYERALHVLHELQALGVNLPAEDGHALTSIELNWLDPDAAMALLVKAHETLGQTGTRALFSPVLADSDRRWHAWNERPITTQGVRLGTTHIQVQGIDIKAYQAQMQTAQNGATPFQIMPEHYLVSGDVTGGRQTIMETFGMLGEPTLTYGTASQTIPVYVPVKRLADHPALMSGETFLVADDLNIHVGAIHQVQPLPDGLDIQSTFFCPHNAPAAIAEGHTIHFALELGGLFTLIAGRTH